jgi:2-polyprenyl-3-methyl-5-hydroxy-6-metoxy-1,4-benzoquinol methylase
MASAGEQAYLGSELELFSQARNWKNYVRALVQPYLGTRVLEIGAGIGATTAALCSGREDRWLCLEPDVTLAARIRVGIEQGAFPRCCDVRVGTIGTLDGDAERFDTILYIDVLEHIADDRHEVQGAVRHLIPGGHLVVVAPAHQWLYSPFDEAIGHFRRYTIRMLLDLTVAGLEPVLSRYVDAAGLGASLANRVLLRASQPSATQLRIWDRLLVPVSRAIDPVFGNRLGKSVVVVWTRLP